MVGSQAQNLVCFTYPHFENHWFRGTIISFERPLWRDQAWYENLLLCSQVLHNRVPSCDSELSLFLTAMENTWVHARQKRREQSRQLHELPRAPEHDTPTADRVDPTPAQDLTDPPINGEETKSKQASEKDTDVPCKTSGTQKQGSSVSAIFPSSSSVHNFLFKCLMNVKVEDSDVLVEMHWVEGQNKDLMNQLYTCIKNSLFRQVAKPI